MIETVDRHLQDTFESLSKSSLRPAFQKCDSDSYLVLLFQEIISSTERGRLP